MSLLKQKTIKKIMEIEGGYVNDPADSGGETNHGITKAVARKYGWHGDMKDLPTEIAFEIYQMKYWRKMRLDEIELISPTIAEELADTGVNMGVTRAGTFLQRSLNVLNDNEKYFPDLKVDGFIGSRTVHAFSAYLSKRGSQGEIVLYRMLNALQGSFYVELAERRKKDERFIFGWFLNRVA